MMNTKLFFVLIAGFTFFMLSCNGESAETPEEDETTDTDWDKESYFTQADLNKIATLKGMLPEIVKAGFEIKYLEWEITWHGRLENAYNSISRHYAKESDEYDSLLMYSLKYGYAILPLIFEKIHEDDLRAKNLLEDLTFPENRHLYDDICSKAEVGTLLRSVWIAYLKILLEKDYDKMLKSIQDISIPEDEVLETNTILINSSNIMLLLYSENEEASFVKIYNSDGELEYESSVTVQGCTYVRFDISNLQEGIYVLQITVGSKTISLKIKRLIIDDLKDIKYK